MKHIRTHLDLMGMSALFEDKTIPTDTQTSQENREQFWLFWKCGKTIRILTNKLLQ